MSGGGRYPGRVDAKEEYTEDSSKIYYTINNA